MEKIKIVAVYGSPRRKGNTATLLKRAVEGARDGGAEVEEIFLRDLKMSPCLEIYGCKNAGECRLKDDFQTARDQILASQHFPFTHLWHDGSVAGGTFRAAVQAGGVV